VLDRYIVERQLGAGGMGEVYRGRHSRLGFPVALKVLSLLRGDYFLRFEREAEMMARIRHPNIITILDYGIVDQKTPCIAMEFVDGETLDARIQARGSLPWTEAIEILCSMLGGLEAIHRANVLHRDLKPANVMLTNDRPEVVKLLDFGIAKSLDPSAAKVTATGGLLGTPAYMAPEQMIGNELDARCDVYTTAMIGYLLVSGALPFADHPRAHFARCSQPMPAPVAPSGRPELPRALVQLLLHALAVEPNHRPPTARLFAEELRSIADGTARPAAASPAPTAIVPPSAAAVPPTVVQGELLDGMGVPPRPTQPSGLVVARLPPSRLARSEERQWLSALVAPARGYVFGGTFWFCVRTHATEEDAERLAKQLVEQITERFGPTAKAAMSVLPQKVELTAGILSGATALPEPIQALVEQLAIG